LTKKVGKAKFAFETLHATDDETVRIKEAAQSRILEMVDAAAQKKMNKEDALGELISSVNETLAAQRGELSEEDKEKYPAIPKGVVALIVEDMFKKTIRNNTLMNGRRADGRSYTEVRDIEIEVGVLPRTHGSAMFQRGMTQTLTTVTLGSPSLEQLIEGPTGEETKRYMHHYNFPPYSVGEAK
jgi:polyribonucleotide nucleotidyltransferase